MEKVREAKWKTEREGEKILFYRAPNLNNGNSRKKKTDKMERTKTLISQGNFPEVMSFQTDGIHGVPCNGNEYTHIWVYYHKIFEHYVYDSQKCWERKQITNQKVPMTYDFSTISQKTRRQKKPMPSKLWGKMNSNLRTLKICKVSKIYLPSILFWKLLEDRLDQNQTVNQGWVGGRIL